MSRKRSLWPVPTLPPSQADRSKSHSADPFAPKSGRTYSAGIPQPANPRGHFGRFVVISLCAVTVFLWAFFYFTFGTGRRALCGPNLSDAPVSQQVTQTMAAQVRAALPAAKLQGTITDVKALHYSASFCNYDKSLLLTFTYRQPLAGQTVSCQRMQIGGVDRYPGRWDDDGHYDQKDARESLTSAILDNIASWAADDEADFPPPPEFLADQNRLVAQATAALSRLSAPGYRFKNVRIVRVFPGDDGVSRLAAIAQANRQSGQAGREELGGYYYLTAAQRMSVFGTHIDVTYQGPRASSKVDRLAGILKRQRTGLAAGRYYFEFSQPASDEACPDCYVDDGEVAVSVADGRFAIDDISH